MIYLNNAATTWPKPEQVYREMDTFLRSSGINPGRSYGQNSLDVEKKIFASREKIASLFNVRDSSRIIFTSGATHSLNLAIKGLLKAGDQVITSFLEHNSVLRPLKKLEKERGIKISFVPVDEQGIPDYRVLEESISSKTRMIIISHASNVIGTVTEIERIGELARQNNIYLLVDAAQTAGVLPLDVERMNIDLLAVPGHKSLYGPPGIGILYIREGLQVDSLMEGGTGSNSLNLEQPAVMPDYYEAGTLNTMGIVGLGAGVDFVRAKGLRTISNQQNMLTSKFLEGLKLIKGVRVYGRRDVKQRVAVVSFNLGQVGAAEIAYLLEKEYGIIIRSGLHCAPLLHRALGTVDQGMVRASFSCFNTMAEIDMTLEAVKDISRKKGLK